MLRIEYDKVPVDPGLTPFLSSLAAGDLFLDIETTGLSREKNKVYLIGTGTYEKEDQSFRVRQIFSESASEEGDLLRSFSEDLGDVKRIITFNGSSFDLPFLQARFDHWKIPSPLRGKVDRDLYLEFRPLRSLLGMKYFNEKALESFLGIHRDDEKSGGDLIRVYHRYEKTRGKDDLSPLLLHNKEDVEGMVPLLKMEAFRGLPTLRADLTTIVPGEEEVLFEGTYCLKDADDKDHASLPAPVRKKGDTYYLIIDRDKIKGALFPKRGVYLSYLRDPTSYVYLPLERKVIPKVLASSLPKDRYRRARPSECYVKKEGAFLPLPDLKTLSPFPGKTRLWYPAPDQEEMEGQKKSSRGIPWLDLPPPTKEEAYAFFIKAYVASLLKALFNPSHPASGRRKNEDG